MDLIFFIWYLTYGFICLTGNRKFVSSVIIWKLDSAFVFSYLFNEVQIVISDIIKSTVMTMSVDI